MNTCINDGRSELPIGVFDSGLGGLTVVREMRRRLPAEKIVYLGDSARVPYGTRSAATVERYSWNCTELLLEKGLKMLVVACNTASAVALSFLRDRIDIPVLGVITAGAREALSQPGVGRVGVIGTVGTVGSGAYPAEIGAIDPGVVVFQNPAPLLVPLAEEGWTEGEVPLLCARKYLTPLVAEGIDVLLLGCTHYPLLLDPLGRALHELGSNAVMVDSATAMTADVARALDEHALARHQQRRGGLTCYVTDLPSSFQEMAGRFLGEPVGDVTLVDIS